MKIIADARKARMGQLITTSFRVGFSRAGDSRNPALPWQGRAAVEARRAHIPEVARSTRAPAPRFFWNPDLPPAGGAA